MTEKTFVYTHKLFPVVGLLLRRLRRKALGKVELPPPHRPGDGVAVLHRLLGGPGGVPTCITPQQRHRLQAMLAELEAWWAANIGRLNDLVRSARTILASNDPATVPATTVLHRSQARMQGTAEAIALLLQLPDAPAASASASTVGIADPNHRSKRQRTDPQAAFGEPERGSPEDEARWRAVMEARALDGRGLMAEWVAEHFDHPFPLPEEKDMLSRLTGLPRAQVANWFVNHRGRVWQPLVIQLGQEIEEEEQQEKAALGQQGFAAPPPLQGGAAAAAADSAAGAKSTALGAGAASADYGSPLQRQHDQHGRLRNEHEQFGGGSDHSADVARPVPRQRLQHSHLRGLEGSDVQPPWGVFGSASAGWQRPSVWGTAAPQPPLQFTPSSSPGAATAEAASRWPPSSQLQLVPSDAATSAAAQIPPPCGQPASPQKHSRQWQPAARRHGTGASAAAPHPAATLSSGFSAPQHQQPAAARTAPALAAGLQPQDLQPAAAVHDLQVSKSVHGGAALSLAALRSSTAMTMAANAAGTAGRSASGPAAIEWAQHSTGFLHAQLTQASQWASTFPLPPQQPSAGSPLPAPSPPQLLPASPPQLDPEAEQRLSGSPLLGSLLTALRRPGSRSSAPSSLPSVGHSPQPSPQLSPQPASRSIDLGGPGGVAACSPAPSSLQDAGQSTLLTDRSGGADSGFSLLLGGATAASIDGGKPSAQQPERAGSESATVSTAAGSAEVSPDADALVLAALAAASTAAAAAEHGSSSAERRPPLRLSPQTPDAQPTRSQQSQPRQ